MFEISKKALVELTTFAGTEGHNAVRVDKTDA